MSIHEHKFSIQLFFDTHSEARIKSLIHELSRLGLINHAYIPEHYRPHISLSCHKALEQEYANHAVASLAEHRPVFPVTFSHYGIFAGAIHALYLGPTLNQSLFDVHQTLHETFSGIRESCWEIYRPFKWVPHCAIMIDDYSEPIHMGLKALMQRDLFKANVQYIAAIGYKENRYYEFMNR